jgi:DNA modification methylase
MADSLDDLKANPKNPRTISKADYAALKKSIEKFGDLSGIVFNITTGQLVGGHQRTQAFLEVGGNKKIIYAWNTPDNPNNVGTVAYGHVDIAGEHFTYREVKWPLEREMAANIAANRIQGNWDMDLLAEANFMLHEEFPDLLELTGQTPDEINNLLDAVGANGDSADDEAPPVDDAQPAVSKLGEIYQLGRHRLMCGDATDFGAISDLFDGAQIDLIFTDPPYGIDIVSDKGTVGTLGLADPGIYEKVMGDDGIETTKKFYEVCEQLEIKKSIIWGGNYFTEFLPFSDGWIIWDKRGDMNGNDFADGEMAWCNFHTPVRIYKQIWSGMIREGEKEQRVHPTQKPTKVLSNILSDFSNRDDKIFDGFGGSGSTLIACDKLDRTCYMMELSPAYCDVIRKRYAKHIGQDDWQAATPIIQPAESAPATE